ncbi:MAG: hypothetical protein RIG62_17920, partial [Cyclobacteriaceae bacterium]
WLSVIWVFNVTMVIRRVAKIMINAAGNTDADGLHLFVKYPIVSTNPKPLITVKLSITHLPVSE